VICAAESVARIEPREQIAGPEHAIRMRPECAPNSFLDWSRANQGVKIRYSVAIE
jgi:hypothetical protein